MLRRRRDSLVVCALIRVADWARRERGGKVTGWGGGGDAERAVLKRVRRRRVARTAAVQALVSVEEGIMDVVVVMAGMPMLWGGRGVSGERYTATSDV